MHFDPRTALVLGALTSLLLGLLLALVSRDIAPVLRPALRLWLRGNLLLPVGFVLFALRGGIHDLLSVSLANVLIVVAFADYTRALYRLAERPAPNRTLAVAIALVAANSVLFSFGIDRIEMRIMVASLVLAGLAAASAGVLLTARPRSTAQWVTGGVFVVGALVMLFRAAYTALHPQALVGGFEPGLTQSVTFATAALLPLLTSYGFLLLCTDRMRGELERTATTDFLTGILNRRAVERAGVRAVGRARRHQHGCAALVADIDHFKRINDAFGHAVGDTALRQVVARLRDGLRGEDMLGRLGGEEFLVLIEKADSERALAAAERLRRAVCDQPLRLEPGPQTVTISIGVAVLDDGDGSFDDLLRRADRALYVAKTGGRNRVELASPGVAAPAAALRGGSG